MSSKNQSQTNVAPDGSFVTWDGYFTWRHDQAGKLLWKAGDQPVRAPGRPTAVCGPAADTLLRHLSSDGATTKSAPIDGSFVALSPDGSVLLTQPAWASGLPKGRNGSVTAVSLATGQKLWSVPKSRIAQTTLSDTPRSILSEASFDGDGAIANTVYRSLQSGGALTISIETIPTRICVVNMATGAVVRPGADGRGDGVCADCCTTATALSLLARVTQMRCSWWMSIPVSHVRIELPESGSYAKLIAADYNSVWVAGDNLYKVTSTRSTSHLHCAASRSRSPIVPAAGCWPAISPETYSPSMGPGRYGEKHRSPMVWLLPISTPKWRRFGTHR